MRVCGDAIGRRPWENRRGFWGSHSSSDWAWAWSALLCSANRAQHYAGLPSAAAKGLHINCILLSLHHTGWAVRTHLSFCEAGMLGLKAKWGIPTPFHHLCIVWVQKVQNIHTVNRAKSSAKAASKVRCYWSAGTWRVCSRWQMDGCFSLGPTWLNTNVSSPSEEKKKACSLSWNN